MTDQGEHPYSYAAADPVDGHDPTGEQDVIDDSLSLAVFLPSVPQIMGAADKIKCIARMTLSVLSIPGQWMSGAAACQARPVGGGSGGSSGPRKGGPKQDPPKAPKRIPSYLQVTNDWFDCWGRAVWRHIDYELHDQNQDVLGSGTVTEHLKPLDGLGNVITTLGFPPNTSSGYPNGIFNDEQSVQLGHSRLFDQTFTASDPPDYVNIPLFVRGFGGDFGVLRIHKTFDEVTINGNRGTPKACR